MMKLKLVKLTKGLKGYALLGDDDRLFIPLSEAWSRWMRGQELDLRPLPEGVRWKQKRRSQLPRYCYQMGEMVEELWREEAMLGDIQFANPEEPEEVEREEALRDHLWYAGFTLDRPNPLDGIAEIACDSAWVTDDEFFLCWEFVKFGRHSPHVVVGYLCRVVAQINSRLG